MYVIKQTKNFHGAIGPIYKRSLVGGINKVPKYLRDYLPE